jgi:flagellar biosynthetic protein FlhB
MAEFEEKSEQATPRRRERAREKGQIPKSRELNALASFAGILMVLYYGSAAFMHSITTMMQGGLTFRYGTDPIYAFRSFSLRTVWLLLPVFAAAAAFAVASNVLQFGFLIKPIEFDLSKTSPLAGIKKIFSFGGLLAFFKNLLIFILGGVIFYLVMRKYMDKFIGLMWLEPGALAAASGAILLKVMLYGFFYLFIIAAISYAFERLRFERSIKMTKQEIKEEMKESDGDPKIKQRIRSIQREMARRRMMAEVPKATVVITNPTHLAVALRYKNGETAAPKLVAKGMGEVAAKIKELARLHNIPIVEDKPLARELFKRELDTFIPEDLYKAVARILAYIYKLKKRF